jgi:hypothetical protein
MLDWLICEGSSCFAELYSQGGNIDPTQPSIYLGGSTNSGGQITIFHVNNFCNQQAASMEGILHLSSVKKPVRIVLMVPEHGSRVIK